MYSHLTSYLLIAVCTCIVYCFGCAVYVLPLAAYVYCFSCAGICVPVCYTTGVFGLLHSRNLDNKILKTIESQSWGT